MKIETRFTLISRSVNAGLRGRGGGRDLAAGRRVGGNRYGAPIRLGWGVYICPSVLHDNGAMMRAMITRNRQARWNLGNRMWPNACKKHATTTRLSLFPNRRGPRRRIMGVRVNALATGDLGWWRGMNKETSSML